MFLQSPQWVFAKETSLFKPGWSWSRAGYVHCGRVRLFRWARLCPVPPEGSSQPLLQENQHPTAAPGPGQSPSCGTRGRGSWCTGCHAVHSTGAQERRSRELGDVSRPSHTVWPVTRQEEQGRELFLAEWKMVLDPFSDVLCSLITNCNLFACTLTVDKQPEIQTHVKTGPVCFIVLSSSWTPSVLTVLSPHPMYDTEHLPVLLSSCLLVTQKKHDSPLRNVF